MVPTGDGHIRKRPSEPRAGTTHSPSTAPYYTEGEDHVPCWLNPIWFSSWPTAGLPRCRVGPRDAGEDDTTASVLASAARGVQGPRTTSWGRALASPTPGRGRSNSHPAGQGTEVLGRPRQQVACRDSNTGGHLVLCICRDDIKKFPWFHPADGKKTPTFSAPSWGKSLGLAAAHAGAVLLSRCGCRCPAGWARVLSSGAPSLQTVTGKDASSMRSQHSEVGLGRGPACNPENSCSPRSKTLPCFQRGEFVCLGLD